jgi:AcrR family transcriptional regulator
VTAAGSTVDSVAPTLGRPRDPEVDRAIAQAALAVLADSGFEGVTVEAVAQRAGVARSTVYRRFPGTPELLESVLHHACRAPVVDADTGSVVEDLLAVVEGLDRSFESTDLGRAMPAVVAAAARLPEIAEAHETFVASRRAVAVAAVQRGIDRGELDPAIEPDTLVDMVVGPVFHRHLVSRRPVTAPWLRELVVRSVRGCSPAPGAAEGAAGGE